MQLGRVETASEIGCRTFAVGGTGTADSILHLHLPGSATGAIVIGDIHQDELGLGDGIDVTRVSYRSEYTRSALGHQLRCRSTDPGRNTGNQCGAVRNHSP